MHADSRDEPRRSGLESLDSVFDRVVTIVHYDSDMEQSVQREFNQRSAQDDPIEFLCLSICSHLPNSQQQVSETSLEPHLNCQDFPSSHMAGEWIRRYRKLEAGAMAAGLASLGSSPIAPLGMVVVVDPLDSSDVDTWLAESKTREELSQAGAMIVERAHPSGDRVDDRQLVLESLHMALTMLAGYSPPSPSAPASPGFDWTVNPPAQAEMYGRQPAHIEDYPPTDPVDFNAHVRERFETYSNSKWRDELDY